MPPALAARLRAALLREDDDEPLLDPERRLVELPDPERALDLRADEPELRELALDLRALELVLRELVLDLRALEPVLREPDPLRELEPRALEPDDLLRDDDPPPLPLFDSAMPILLRRLPAAR